MVFIDVGAIVLMLALFVAAIAVVRGDKSKQREDQRLRDELATALHSDNSKTLKDFLVLWNDKLTKDQKEAIELRIDDLVVEENP